MLFIAVIYRDCSDITRLYATECETRDNALNDFKHSREYQDCNEILGYIHYIPEFDL